jgi:uncharacterized protein YndB with AHSA1/START domain
MSTVQTTIEREIVIDASVERVWGIVSEPGWWVNSGTLVDHRIEDLGEGTHLIHDPEHGEFRIITVELNPPRYAAFRWQPTGPDDPATLTEFWIDDRSDGGVSLRVVESGFDDLPADKLHAFVKDNSQGWEFELAVARTAAEAR